MKLTPTIAKNLYKKKVAGADDQASAEASAKLVVDRGAAAKKNWDDGFKALPEGAFKRSLVEH